MVDKIVGRVMLTAGLMIFLALFVKEAHARTVSVFDVRQNIPLTNDEPVYRDYYINGGVDVGLTVGMTVKVERRISMHDSFQNHSPGSLLVETGQLKIIHVQESVSVGRLVGVPTPENYPVIDHDTVMVGDTLNLGVPELQEEPQQADLLPKTAPSKPTAPVAKKVDEETVTEVLRSAPPKKKWTINKEKSYLQTQVIPVRPGPPVVVR